LQDRGGNGHGALVAARNQLLGLAAQSKIVTGVRPDGLEDASQLQLEIDRDKASALGVSFDAINAAISTALGSAYVNDFPNAGRLQRVIVQADAPSRMQGEDLLRLNAVNARGQPVPLAAFASTHWITGPMQTIRYNGYPTMRIGGDAAPGRSTGEAMDEMEHLRHSCRPASPTNGPASRARKSSRARPRSSCSASRCSRCSCASPRSTRAGRFRCR